jgi:hypothetical protein
MSRCAGAVRRSGEDNTVGPGAGRSAKLSLTEGEEKRDDKGVCSAEGAGELSVAKNANFSADDFER